MSGRAGWEIPEWENIARNDVFATISRLSVSRERAVATATEVVDAVLRSLRAAPVVERMEAMGMEGSGGTLHGQPFMWIEPHSRRRRDTSPSPEVSSSSEDS